MKSIGTDEFTERLDFALKIRGVGVTCSALCLAARLFIFPKTINPFIALIPLAISLVINLIKFTGGMVIIYDSDSENPDEDISREKLAEGTARNYIKARDEFEEKHRLSRSLIKFGICFEIIISAAVAIFDM